MQITIVHYLNVEITKRPISNKYLSVRSQQLDLMITKSFLQRFAKGPYASGSPTTHMKDFFEVKI